MMETENDVSWKGVHISQLRTSLNLPQHPELVKHEEHTILFKIPLSPGKVPQCYPSIFNKQDFWDSNHVKLPCSEKNVSQDEINQWNLIRNALTSRIVTSEQLQAAILSYNAPHADQWNFAVLHSFFEEVLDETESTMFFETLLPKIIDLALRLPELITGGIPLLKRGHRHSVSLSQLQISCLLANAFLCTFPFRNAKRDSEYFDYPHMNFHKLFQCFIKNRTKSVHEKIKCIFNYFRRVTDKTPTGVVTYSRQFIPNNLFPNWSESRKKLPQLYVSSEGTIEDDGFGLFQVDFANKSVGGGVVGTGCVQEEIRFIICPELIVSRLFTQRLGENEALVVTGCERFNKYKGYASCFKWDGDFVDGTPSDQYGRKYCTVVALDALHYQRNHHEQYIPKNFLRDMTKAYVGFSWGSRRKKEELCAVATGNWGCGVFKGDPELKSFLQMMAAAEVGRDLAYFTFGNVELRDGMAAVHQSLKEKDVTIGELIGLLNEYNAKKLYETISLFEFLRNETLKMGELINTESDLHKLNVSDDLPRLDITKRSFRCKTKVSDWFSPVDKVNSPTNDEQENARLETEKQMLKNFYQTSAVDQRRKSETTPMEEDCFGFLNKLKTSMKRERKTPRRGNESDSLSNVDENIKKVSNAEGRRISDTNESFDQNLENSRIRNAEPNETNVENLTVVDAMETKSISKAVRTSLTDEQCLGAEKESSVCDNFANETVRPSNSANDSLSTDCDLTEAPAKRTTLPDNVSCRNVETVNQSSHEHPVKEIVGAMKGVSNIHIETNEIQKKGLDQSCDKTASIAVNTRVVNDDNNFKKRKISDYFSPKI